MKPPKIIASWKNSGVTLVELMITVAILAIGVLAGVSSFQYITKSIQNSKTRTLANNLAQEQIEKLKNLSYYTLLVTTNTTQYPGLLGVYYDTGNYPPATMIEGGVHFTRLTRVDFANQTGTVLTTAPWTFNDTGLKLITTYVVWQMGDEIINQEMHNLMANPAANPLNATFTGTVREAGTGTLLAGANIQVVDNTNWYGITNSLGVYSFAVSQGSYTLTCSSTGFFPSTTHNYQSITSGVSLTVDFTMSRMSSGTAVGNVYLNDHLVISQVVASTGPTNDLEYVELYNPTASPINIGNAATVDNPNVVPMFWDRNNNVQMRHMVYVSTFVPSHGYYLITNTGNGTDCTSAATFFVSGNSRTPDACWKVVTYPKHAIECGGNNWDDTTCPEAGGFSLGNTSSYSGNLSFISANWPSVGKIDSIAWSKNSSSHSAPDDAVEGTGISVAGGLTVGKSFMRTSMPGSITAGQGRAYDSDDNSHDFMEFDPLPSTPDNSSTNNTPVSGTPATGAYVSFNDPLSSLTLCSSTTLTGGYKVCAFRTVSIATGTWTMIVSSNSYYSQTSNIVMGISVTTGVPSAGTSPAWSLSGTTTTLLSGTTNFSFISGVVSDANGVPLNNILINVSGYSTYTNSTGRYFISSATGDVRLSANYNNTNRAYTSGSYDLISLVSGTLYDNPIGSNPTYFTLSLGGIIKGYFQTSSNTALPGRVAVALSGGNEAGQAVSGNDGYFYINNMTTGSYTLQPSLDPAEAASPTSAPISLTSTGTTTSVSTFTVTNGLGMITGQVILGASTAAINTGVLVYASSATLSGGVTTPPPRVLGGSSSLCNPCTYAGSSDSVGYYEISVRASTTPYQLYGWYTTFNGTTPTLTRKGGYSVLVSSPGQIMSYNLSW